MSSFFRYPHTPHLHWAGDSPPRADKILSDGEQVRLLEAELVVEEKVDGANVGISVDSKGAVRLQNRGAYIGAGAHPQFEPIWPWVYERAHLLKELLEPRLLLFGEWCFAKHSIRYDALEDWFLGFDVYDREKERFWSVDRRNGLLDAADVVPVPELARGRFELPELEEFLSRRSAAGAEQLEGVVVRNDCGGWNSRRAKLVRHDFVQHIDDHWSRALVVQNELRRS